MSDKRNEKIFRETVARWRNTLMDTAQPDVTAAKKLIHRVYGRDTRIFVVNTPLEFYIAQAVIRKRLPKFKAKELHCEKLGISPDFLKDLRGIGGMLPNYTSTWNRHGAANALQRAMIKLLQKITVQTVKPDDTRIGANEVIYGGRRWRPRQQSNDMNNLQNIVHFNTNDLHNLYHRFFTWEIRQKHPEIEWPLNFDTRAIASSCMTVYSSVSNNPLDIITADGREYSAANHSFDVTQAEMVMRIMGCKDEAITLSYELLHCVPAYMRFHKAFLLMGGRPTITLDADGNLHNDTGPAVQYSDGTGFWFLDGHILESQGKKIVTAPETLTSEEIQAIVNEEEKRLAIERFGWDKYMTGVGARIIDKRENWVDNTVELLVQIPAYTDPVSRRNTPEQLQTVLSCRSTGRRYMLAVPNTTSTDWFLRSKARPIKTCDDVQNWMANGALAENLAVGKHPMRVVGAS